MTVTFTHDEHDYLDQQLYVASISKPIIQRRQRGRILIPFFAMIMIGLQFYKQNYFFAIYALVVAIAWYFLYPLFEKKRYQKFYQKYIAENFKDRFNKEISAEFKSNSILMKDISTSGEINYSEIEKIIEIPSSYYIKLKSSAYLIFPKDKTNDLNTLNQAFDFLKEKFQVPFSNEMKWKWK